VEVNADVPAAESHNFFKAVDNAAIGPLQKDIPRVFHQTQSIIPLVGLVVVLADDENKRPNGATARETLRAHGVGRLDCRRAVVNSPWDGLRQFQSAVSGDERLVAAVLRI
jgi:hypothetical protein